MTGDPAACDGDGEPTTEADCMLAVYRHDLHKLRGRSHLDATETLAGQRVNESVPHGADRDAALLSRPGGHPEQTVPAHNSPFRLSLGTGAQVIDAVGIDALGDAVQEFVTIQDAATAHRAWLNSAVAAAMNESLYYPYTSLKYHVLLTAALLDAYRDGAAFSDLWLALDDPEDGLTPHRTVLHTDRVSLRLTPNPGDRPAAPLGDTPARSFADVWTRLPARPAGIDPDGDRRWRILDAQLRRIRAWSTALQYLEDCLSAGTVETDTDRTPIDGGWSDAI